jgi:hypothetical protein
VTHKGKLKETMAKYVATLRTQGWTENTGLNQEENYKVMDKDGKQITIWGTEAKDNETGIIVDITKAADEKTLEKY